MERYFYPLWDTWMLGSLVWGIWIQKSQIQFTTLLVYWNSIAKDKDTMIFLYPKKKKKNYELYYDLKLLSCSLYISFITFFFSNIEYTKLFSPIIYILSKCKNCIQLTWSFFFFFFLKKTTHVSKMQTIYTFLPFFLERVSTYDVRFW